METVSKNKNMVEDKSSESNEVSEDVLQAIKNGPEEDTTEKTLTGTVRWFSARRGYGFITEDSTGKDYYVHYSGITGTGFRKLLSGEAVEFEVGVDKANRPVAMNVVQLTGFTAIDDPKVGQ